ncbi:MAG TPA: hypothetical protein VM577_08625, partial [Anaerovoracaceae bacterium]|nr:hypothetical protein [Anaerovoracaceae bacterium]
RDYACIGLLSAETIRDDWQGIVKLFYESENGRDPKNEFHSATFLAKGPVQTFEYVRQAWEVAPESFNFPPPEYRNLCELTSCKTPLELQTFMLEKTEDFAKLLQQDSTLISAACKEFKEKLGDIEPEEFYTYLQFNKLNQSLPEKSPEIAVDSSREHTVDIKSPMDLRDATERYIPPTTKAKKLKI